MAQLQSHTSRYFCQTTLPFNYDPRARCPNFICFLKQILPRKHAGDKRLEIIQEMMGYTLLMQCPYEVAILLAGCGSNGKSTLLRVWQAMLGSPNVSHIPLEQITEKFRLLGLRGKLMNISTEAHHLGKYNEAMLKQIISGEPIETDVKHKTPVTFTPFVKLVIASNALPTFTDTSDGFWRRWIIVPFEQKFEGENRNEHLAAELMEELPGIFNFAIRGLRRLQQQGGFTRCQVCDAVIAQHRQQSDSVKDFIATCCKRVAGGAAHAQALYDVYTVFCERSGRKAVSKVEFGRRLAGDNLNNVRAATGNRPHVYAGLNTVAAAAEFIKEFRFRKSPTWEVVNVQIPGLPSELSE